MYILKNNLFTQRKNKTKKIPIGIVKEKIKIMRGN